MTAISSVDGIGFKNMTDPTPRTGILAGRGWNAHGQTANTSAADVANQIVGTVSLPAVNALATGTATITNSLITTLSLIFVTVKLGATADSGAGRGLCVQLQAPAAGSCVVEYTPLINMVNAWSLHYWVIN